MTCFHHLARGACLASALMSGVLIAGAALAGSACNKTPVPPQSTLAIGRDMIVNGVPASVVGMQFAGTTDDVSKAFRDFWTGENVPAKGQRNSSGLLLSALDRQCLYVLSIPPQAEAGRTRGLMSVIRLDSDQAGHRLPDSAVPLPENSKVVSDIESRDPQQTGRTWLLDIPGEARWNAQRYRNDLAARGWVSVGRQPDYQFSGSVHAEGTAFAMQRGSDSVDASFSDRDGRTVAIVNAIRNR
ncbi:conserved exported hypothetical protein [Paraburkholderia ribeironis]|uniref:Lipoprotein n=1 Tax=Paraburkholderia ribeironis TaxID=1247936 RepID=A0A1N7SEG3_9BURK|nr:hypothetical protein [Paraburkholderia ribeironis]SIT45761.1 conserved exported hypothetical protein [Paraburkholderia ribeironis]